MTLGKSFLFFTTKETISYYTIGDNMKEKGYDREKARQYAEKWAYLRNPVYYNFDSLGGDCTNFVSQCIFAGGGVMNYTKEKGWYYQNGNDKSPSWSGVEFLYQFLRKNQSVGPYGRECLKQELQIGDMIQLSFNGQKFAHSLFVVGKEKQISVATHTFDSYYRDLESYSYQKIRYFHIEGVRIW